MRLLCVALLGGLSLVACSGKGGVCGPQSCGGCCTADGFCASGTDQLSCGERGGSCVSCDAMHMCMQGNCVASAYGGGGGGAGGGAGGGGVSMGGGTATGGGTSDGGATGGGATDGGSESDLFSDGRTDGGCAPAICHCGNMPVVLHNVDYGIVEEEFPDMPYSMFEDLRDDARACGGAGVIHSLARWDTTRLAGALVKSAQVQFQYVADYNQYSGAPRRIDLELAGALWDGQTVTWNTRPPEAGQLANTSLVDNVGAYVNFQVPYAPIQAWIDSNSARTPGVILKFDNEQCPSPRWPARFSLDVTLIVTCN
jgi:hypothetical protein